MEQEIEQENPKDAEKSKTKMIYLVLGACLIAFAGIVIACRKSRTQLLTGNITIMRKWSSGSTPMLQKDMLQQNEVDMSTLT